MSSFPASLVQSRSPLSRWLLRACADRVGYSIPSHSGRAKDFDCSFFPSPNLFPLPHRAHRALEATNCVSPLLQVADGGAGRPARKLRDRRRGLPHSGRHCRAGRQRSIGSEPHRPAINDAMIGKGTTKFGETSCSAIFGIRFGGAWDFYFWLNASLLFC